MAGRRPFFTTPWRSVKDVPLTSGMAILLASYDFWLGTILIRVTDHLPPERLLGYAGPLSVCSISTWGWLHISAGIIRLLRLCIQADQRVGVYLHLLSMSVILAWAVTFDVGPPTTGQPVYTFVAVVSFLSIFMVQIIEARYGRRRPLLPTKFLR